MIKISEIKASFHKQKDDLFIWRCWRQPLWGLGNAHFPYQEDSSLMDKALSVTSWSLASDYSEAKKRRLERLIELGANVRVDNWHAFRMAACSGNVNAMRWLAGLSMPSPDAIDDALAWANHNKDEVMRDAIYQWRDDIKKTVLQKFVIKINQEKVGHLRVGKMTKK